MHGVRGRAQQIEEESGLQGSPSVASGPQGNGRWRSCGGHEGALEASWRWCRDRLGDVGRGQQEVDALSPGLAQLSPSPTPSTSSPLQGRPFPGAPWRERARDQASRLAEGPRPSNPACHLEGIGPGAGMQSWGCHLVLLSTWRWDRWYHLSDRHAHLLPMYLLNPGMCQAGDTAGVHGLEGRRR